jgi:hypothetical protein
MAYRGYNSVEQLQSLKEQLHKYQTNEAPFNTPWGRARIHMLGCWRTRRHPTGEPLEISRLGVTLLTVVPHAADPELVFSTFGWLTGKLRPRMLATNMHMLAKVAMHYRQRPAPKVSLHLDRFLPFLFHG